MIIRYAATAALAAVAIATPAVAATIHPIDDPNYRYAPCAQEDGPGPCIWDARHTGNGIGHSFYMNRNGDVRFIPHHIAHYLTH